MPPLVACGRSWPLLAADDVSLLAAPAAILHTMWTVVLAILLLYPSSSGPAALLQSHLRLPLQLMLACFCATCILEWAMAFYATRGPPLECHKRRHMPVLLLLHVLASAAQLATTAAVTVLLLTAQADSRQQAAVVAAATPTSSAGHALPATSTPVQALYKLQYVHPAKTTLAGSNKRAWSTSGQVNPCNVDSRSRCAVMLGSRVSNFGKRQTAHPFGQGAAKYVAAHASTPAQQRKAAMVAQGWHLSKVHDMQHLLHMCWQRLWALVHRMQQLLRNRLQNMRCWQLLAVLGHCGVPPAQSVIVQARTTTTDDPRQSGASSSTVWQRQQRHQQQRHQQQQQQQQQQHQQQHRQHRHHDQHLQQQQQHERRPVQLLTQQRVSPHAQELHAHREVPPGPAAAAVEVLDDVEGGALLLAVPLPLALLHLVVWSSWAVQVVNLLLLAWGIWTLPQYRRGTDAWEYRMQLLVTLVQGRHHISALAAPGVTPSTHSSATQLLPQSRLGQLRAKWRRRHPLRRIGRVLSRLTSPCHLTPLDVVTGAVLAAAAQRQRRKQALLEMLQQYKGLGAAVGLPSAAHFAVQAQERQLEIASNVTGTAEEGSSSVPADTAAAADATDQGRGHHAAAFAPAEHPAELPPSPFQLHAMIPQAEDTGDSAFLQGADSAESAFLQGAAAAVDSCTPAEAASSMLAATNGHSAPPCTTSNTPATNSDSQQHLIARRPSSSSILKGSSSNSSSSILKGSSNNSSSRGAGGRSDKGHRRTKSTVQFAIPEESSNVAYSGADGIEADRDTDRGLRSDQGVQAVAAAAAVQNPSGARSSSLASAVSRQLSWFLNSQGSWGSWVSEDVAAPAGATPPVNPSPAAYLGQGDALTTAAAAAAAPAGDPADSPGGGTSDTAGDTVCSRAAAAADVPSAPRDFSPAELPAASASAAAPAAADSSPWGPIFPGTFLAAGQPSLVLPVYRQYTLMQPQVCLTPTAMMEQLLQETGVSEPEARLVLGRHAVPQDVLSAAAHYGRYAIATYATLPRLSAASALSTYLQPLVKRLLQRGAARSDPAAAAAGRLGLTSRMEQRLFQQLVTAADVSEDQVVYLNLQNACEGSLPYFVAVDDATRSVVVSVRGTFSMEDTITDILCLPINVAGWLPPYMKERLRGCGAPLEVHAGMLEAADTILADLKDKNVLGALLLHGTAQQARGGSADARGAVAAAGAAGGGGAATVGGAEGLAGSQGCDAGGGGHTAVAAAGDCTGVAAGGSGVAADGRRMGDGAAGSLAAEGKGLPKAKRRPPGASHAFVSTRNLAGQVEANLLEAELLLGAEERHQQQHDCRGWKLVVVGHSLGAGVATLLAIQLKQQFPDTTCWAFSPPGALLSPALSSAVGDFVTSVVTGKDLVPRLSLVTLERLRDDIMTSLARCRYSKLRVLLGSLSASNRQSRADQVLLPYADMPREPRWALNSYHSSLEGAPQPPEMLPPGRVVFLAPLKRQLDAAAGPTAASHANTHLGVHLSCADPPAMSAAPGGSSAGAAPDDLPSEQQPLLQHAGDSSDGCGGSTGWQWPWCGKTLRQWWHHRRQQQQQHARQSRGGREPQAPPNPAEQQQQQRVFQAVWLQPAELLAEGVLLSRHMMQDHSLLVTVPALQMLSTGGTG